MSSLIEQWSELFKELYEGEDAEMSPTVLVERNMLSKLLRVVAAAEELAKEVEGMELQDSKNEFEFTHGTVHPERIDANISWRSQRDKTLSNYRNKIKGV